MRVRQDLGLQVATAIKKAQAAGDLPAFDIPQVVIEKPRDVSYGDYATPSAMQMARLARMAPLKIAEVVVDHLPRPDYVSEVTISPPGFINFRLESSFIQKQVEAILSPDKNYGSFDLGQGKRTQVEFVSANPTGPLTVGRGRGGVMGDTLARAMMAASFQVSREYYFNNAGRQIDILGESLQVRHRQALGHDATPG